MNADRPPYSTVSYAFIADWIGAFSAICPAQQRDDILTQCGLHSLPPDGPVTSDQITDLYQSAALATADEMMGLWSRPVRAGALKHLATTVRAGSTPRTALFRFTEFWNLLLDDYTVHYTADDGTVAIALHPNMDAPLNRFGHALLLKLSHGLLSWLAGREVQVDHVCFAFPEPEFAVDYAALFPCPVTFDAPQTTIWFPNQSLVPNAPRSDEELRLFLSRAPRDWIFTGFREHSLVLKLRGYLYDTEWSAAHITPAAQALGLSERTLERKLHNEKTSFQAIKDALRRDIALQALRNGRSVENVSEDLGFSSPANFHRAFVRWTGQTPGAIRHRTSVEP